MHRFLLGSFSVFTAVSYFLCYYGFVELESVMLSSFSKLLWLLDLVFASLTVVPSEKCRVRPTQNLSAQFVCVLGAQ